MLGARVSPHFAMIQEWQKIPRSEPIIANKDRQLGTTADAQRPGGGRGAKVCRIRILYMVYVYLPTISIRDTYTSVYLPTISIRAYTYT